VYGVYNSHFYCLHELVAPPGSRIKKIEICRKWLGYLHKILSHIETLSFDMGLKAGQISWLLLIKDKKQKNSSGTTAVSRN
jgi:hypothetical protein